MVKTAKHLLVGSMEAYTGKSAAIVGIGRQLRQRGFDLAYGKILGTCYADEDEKNRSRLDADAVLMTEHLQVSPGALPLPLIFLNEETLQHRLLCQDTTDYQALLQSAIAPAQEDILFLEGPATLEEGSLFNLALPQVAHYLDAPVLLIARFELTGMVDLLLSAKQRLGDRLLGVVINDITAAHFEDFHHSYVPFLEAQNIPVLGKLPRSNILRSVCVAELARQLNAQILCRPDRLDLMVETLRIGAMNVNWALKYFRKGRNMAVVTGGDRTDIQMAALETSTQCLVLTGQVVLSELVKSRAEELEIPILAVDLDTLTTVEIIDRTFGKARLQEPIKVQSVCELMAEHFDLDRFLTQLNLG